VLPALHYGTGGGHGDYPWTIMMPAPTHIAAQIEFTIDRLESFGIKLVVLFSGHFPDEQLHMIDNLAKAKSAAGSQVIAISVNRIEGLSLKPDHAGIFETTLLAAMWPELVQLERLPSLAEAPLADTDVWEQGRHNPKHPIWGVVGPDPRHFESREATNLLNKSVSWLVGRVSEAYPRV